jgi:acetolactate synthase-1/2/3 large subunit
MLVAEYVAKFIKKKKINDLFMLTGYGAMYLNDAIAKENIKYYATRNEATAPIMAAAYARSNKSKLGIACVTAGPGSTNAVPGLAEAFVDSSPIVVFSGQVDRKHTTISTNLKNIRTFGTAEINIIPIVKPLTKYAVSIKNEKQIRYVLEKAFYEAQNGRPGPVWIDIPLDIQNKKIIPSTLKSFLRPKKFKNDAKKINKSVKEIISRINLAKKPIIVCGQGVKISNTFNQIYNISQKKNIPIFFTRASQDLCSHKKNNILGQAGIKGTKYCKRIMTQSDLVISFGCRMAPQFAGHEFEAFKNAKII